MGDRVVVTALGGPEVLRVETAAAPSPKAGEVLIAVEAAGVAFADILMRQGRYPAQPAVPFIPGYDVVGRVAALGPGVTGVAVGARVAAMTVTGGYAAACVARAAWAVPIPEDVDAVRTTALVLNYLTAWQMLRRSADVAGDGSILVLSAAGGVGSALVELAALEGIRIYGTASTARRPVLEARGVRVVEPGSLAHEVDATFDAVGGPSLGRSRAATKKGGTVVSYGISFAVDGGLSRLGGFARHGRALATTKITPGAKVVLYDVTRGAKKDPAAFRDDLGQLVALLSAGRIRPEVTAFPLAEAAEAQRRLEAREIVGKAVLVV